jgi:hypothetical protein
MPVSENFSGTDFFATKAQKHKVFLGDILNYKTLCPDAFVAKTFFEGVGY